MKCPECSGNMVSENRQEEFDYDTGERIVRVIAVSVPIKRCTSCELVCVGPNAAKVRAMALQRALVE